MVANRTRPTLEKRAKERARQEKRKQKEERRATAKAHEGLLHGRKATKIRISPASSRTATVAMGRRRRALSRVQAIPHSSWAATGSAPASVAPMLEQGAVVFLPNLSFSVQPSEHEIFSPAILSSSKNTSYDPATDHVGGTTLPVPSANSCGRS